MFDEWKDNDFRTIWNCADRVLALPIRTVRETCFSKGKIVDGGQFDDKWTMRCDEHGHIYEGVTSHSLCTGTISRTITLSEALETLEKIAERYQKHQKYRPMHDLDLDDLLKGWAGAAIYSLSRPSPPQWQIRPALGGGVHLCLTVNRVTGCGNPVTIQRAVEHAVDNGATTITFARGVYDAAEPKANGVWLPVTAKGAVTWVWEEDWRKK